MNKITSTAVTLIIGLAIGGAIIWSVTKPDHESTEAGQSAQLGKKERKISYYRNPMNPKVTSPVFMKDSMGMDYVAVYEDDASKETSAGVVRISTERRQKIGVRSEEVQRRDLSRTIRTVGRIEPVENNISVINAKVQGWIEKLYVDRTDRMVMAGEKLLELYSPELVSAQEEFLLAARAAKSAADGTSNEAKKSANAILNAAKARLRNWDISGDQIKKLSETGVVTRTMTIFAPITGSVTEKMVVTGQKIEPGEALFKIIDHSIVWVYAEIYEYEMPYVKAGDYAVVTPSYDPKKTFRARIDHIFSHLGSARYMPESSTEIRTVKIRMELPNTDHKLKLGMYMNVELPVHIARNAIAIPDSALIDTGVRTIVIIDRRDGTFEPRSISVGGHADGYVEITNGIKKGEWAVTSANFLIDSESNLASAIGGLSSPDDKPGKTISKDQTKANATKDAHAGH